MASNSIYFGVTGMDIFLPMPDGGFISSNTPQYDSGYELYYPYLCRLTSDFDTLWTRD